MSMTPRDRLERVKRKLYGEMNRHKKERGRADNDQAKTAAIWQELTFHKAIQIVDEEIRLLEEEKGDRK